MGLTNYCSFSIFKQLDMRKPFAKYLAAALGILFLLCYLEVFEDECAQSYDTESHVFVGCESFDGSAVVKVAHIAVVKSFSAMLSSAGFHFTLFRYHTEVCDNACFSLGGRRASLYLENSSFRI